MGSVSDDKALGLDVIVGSTVTLVGCPIFGREVADGSNPVFKDGLLDVDGAAETVGNSVAGLGNEAEGADGPWSIVGRLVVVVGSLPDGRGETVGSSATKGLGAGDTVGRMVSLDGCEMTGLGLVVAADGPACAFDVGLLEDDGTTDTVGVGVEGMSCVGCGEIVGLEFDRLLGALDTVGNMVLLDGSALEDGWPKVDGAGDTVGANVVADGAAGLGDPVSTDGLCPEVGGLESIFRVGAFVVEGELGSDGCGDIVGSLSEILLGWLDTVGNTV